MLSSALACNRGTLLHRTAFLRSAFALSFCAFSALSPCQNSTEQLSRSQAKSSSNGAGHALAMRHSSSYVGAKYISISNVYTMYIELHSEREVTDPKRQAGARFTRAIHVGIHNHNLQIHRWKELSYEVLISTGRNSVICISARREQIRIRVINLSSRWPNANQNYF